MMNLSFGGDNEYTDAAARAAASGGGIGTLIGGILQMLGIHTPVAAPPKDGSKEASNAGESKKKTAKKGEQQEKSALAPQPMPTDVLSRAGAALGIDAAPPLTASQWDARYAQSLTPIDPNVGMIQGLFDQAFGKR